jgi:hypothetical protein
MTPLVLSARLTFAASLLIATAANAQDSARSKVQPKALQTRVWVNNSTRVYHCPGNRYYGKTRTGEFMEEAQARGYGIRAYTGTGCANVATPARAPLPDTTAALRRMVWLNTESRIYHCPNTADWGATRRGRYLYESDAIAAGHRPAAGKKCRP